MASVSPPSAAATPDPLAESRERTQPLLYRCGLACLLPLIALNLWEERQLMAALVAVLCACLALNLWAVTRGRRAPISFAVLLVPGLAAMWVVVEKRGPTGLFWAFPAALFFYFGLRRALANGCAALMLAVGAWRAWELVSWDVALRFALTLGALIGVMNLILAALERLQERLTFEATRDALTGAYNRREMTAQLAAAVERQRRHAHPSTLLVLDLDHFKTVNDTLGHDAGDRVLQGLVGLVQARMRRTDTLFRTGGEEFVLLMPDTPVPEALTLAEALRTQIATAAWLPDRPVTASVGAAPLQPGQDVNAWLRAADQALYAAKAAGRNRVVLAPGGAHTAPTFNAGTPP